MDDAGAGENVRVREGGGGAERAGVRVGMGRPGAVEEKEEGRAKERRKRGTKMEGNEGKGSWRGGRRCQGWKRGVEKAKKGTGIYELGKGGPQEQMGGK